jgi:hypothetical protein
MGAFTIRTTLFGILSWLVPFVAAFAFFDSTGQVTIPQPLFKSIMVVVFGGFGAALLVVAFERVPATLANGLAIGIYWLAINWLLDIVVLLPFTGMQFGDYFADIGLRYLLIPIMAAAIGFAAERARR